MVSRPEECMVGHELGHGLGLSMYEYPIIERLYSFQYPQTFEREWSWQWRPRKTIRASVLSSWKKWL